MQIHFLPFLPAPQIPCMHKGSNTCDGLNFHPKDIFLNVPDNVLYEALKSFILIIITINVTIIVYVPFFYAWMCFFSMSITVHYHICYLPSMIFLIV